MESQKIPTWLSASLIAGACGLLIWFERRRPLRREVESKTIHSARNLAVAAAGAATLQLVERPVIEPLVQLVERRKWGLLKRLQLPSWLETTLAIVLLDYTLYLWHVLTHRLPCLWRFHLAHHVDLDLDTTTALRFHFGELMFSVPWRAGQVVLIGVSPRAFSIWQTGLFISALFHHSNVQLPLKVERPLNRLVVTPRMHGIHHSLVKEETNSNWSSGLALWDWLHGTLRLEVPQDEITIGVPAYRAPEEVTLIKVLTLPFTEQRSTWKLPSGEQPARHKPTDTAPEQIVG